MGVGWGVGWVGVVCWYRGLVLVLVAAAVGVGVGGLLLGGVGVGYLWCPVIGAQVDRISEL